jgi:hypothetical protein
MDMPQKGVRMTFFQGFAAANVPACSTRSCVAQSFVSALYSMRVRAGAYKATQTNLSVGGRERNQGTAAGVYFRQREGFIK